MTILRDESTTASAIAVRTEVHARMRIGQLYISDDPADNAPLTLHLINDGDQPLALTPPDPPGSGSRLSMTLSNNLVPVKGLGTLHVTTDGWTCSCPPGSFPAIVMTPDGPTSIEPGHRLTFTIENLSVHASAGEASVKISYRNLGPSPSGTLTAPVSITTKPQGGFTIDCSRKQIFVTRTGQAEVANTIEFAIRMWPTTPPPTPTAPPPVFSLFFNYGSGYGTLAALDHAQHGVLVQSGGPLWKPPVQPKPGSDSAVWTMSPGSVALLAAGADFSFQLTNIISQIAADQTEFAEQPVDMYVQYSGVPGMPDGVCIVPLSKALAKPGILQFVADRTDVDAGERVNLSWTTFAVDRLELHYSRYADGSEHGVVRPAFGESALTLTKNGYDVYPTLDPTLYTLYGYSSGSRDPVGSWPITLKVYRPAFEDRSVQGTPGYDGEEALITWRAVHADGVTITDALTNTAVPVLQQKTTLTSACEAGDSMIRVESTNGFPPDAGFKVQVDQEFMTVTARGAGTLWAVDRDDMERARHSTGTPVVSVSGSARVRVKRGYTHCRLRAWKKTDPDPRKTGIAEMPSLEEPAVDVLIRPRIAAAAEPIVVPEGGGPVQISWTIDQPADVWLQPGTTLAMPWTVRVDGPAVLTLTAGSGTGNNHVESTAQVSIGRYRVKTIPMPPEQQVCMGFSYDGRRLCVLSGRTVSLIDVATLTVSGQFAVPSSDADGNSVAPVAFGVRDRGPYAGPLFGVAIDWLGQRRIWVIDTGRDQLVYAPNYLVAGEIRSALALTSDGVVLSRPGDIPQTPTPESIARQMQTLRKNTAYILSGLSNAVLVASYEFPS